MKKRVLRAHVRGVLVLLCLSTALCGCDDEPDEPKPRAGAEAGTEAGVGAGTPSPAANDCAPTAGEEGGESAGEVPAGEVMSGEVPAGEITAGEVMGGELPAGEVMGGEVPAGEVMGGEVTSGEAMGGEMMGGEMMGGEVMGGEVMGGNPIPPEASDRYDGRYFATFESEGYKSALAKVTVRGGLIEGELINRYGERVVLGGFLDENGVLRIPELVGDMGSRFTAVGRVTRQGSIEGTFTASGMVEREGTFAGSLDNHPVYRPSAAYDGLYQLAFVREGVEVAVTSLQIDHGQFSVNIVSAAGLRFTAQGFVSEDGTLALLGVTPSEVLAEAYIDPDEKRIQGIYVIGRGGDSLIGDIQGREAD